MKVLVSGSSGLIGSRLLPELERAGHEIAILRRTGSASNAQWKSIAWDPVAGAIDKGALDAWGADAVVHLSGKNIAGQRWNEKVKAEIRESRVEATQRLCQDLLELNHPPKAFVSASAIGCYGDRGEELLTEESPPGEGFLGKLVVAWEEASCCIEMTGCRRVCLRFGVVLSPAGGALGKMLPLFRLGLGGRLGSGRQWMSWVCIEDVIGAILFTLDQPISGALNVTAPEPVRNRGFTKILARALHRPAILLVPAFALRTMLGREMADALLLTSQRVLPGRLEESGFQYKHPTLSECLGQML